VKRGLVALGLLATVAAGCGSTRTVTTTVTVGAKAGVGAPHRQVWFGTIRALTRHGDGYLLRFDPQWSLAGVTANAAAVEDGVLAPGDAVPNDYYRVDEGHRVLTFRVPPNARVTVLSRGVQGSRVTVAQLAGLVRDERALGHPLFEPLRTGFWLQVDIDTVRSLDQQYVP
jgi:hypothetical protein